MAEAPQEYTYSAVGGAAVTPSDVAIVTPMARALYIGGEGNVAIEGPDGSVVTYTAVPAGTQLQAQAVRVLATGTTATNIVAMR